MRKTNPVILFLSCFTILLLGACSKDTPENEKTDPLENITGKYFIRKSVTSNPAYPLGNGTSSTDMYRDYFKDECVLDDLRYFKPDGILIYDNGATKCHDLEDQSSEQHWTFLENQTKLETLVGPVRDTGKILINDGHTLQLEKIRRKAGIEYVWIETWVKKQ
jgi:hypothetical protein